MVTRMLGGQVDSMSEAPLDGNALNLHGRRRRGREARPHRQFARLDGIGDGSRFESCRATSRGLLQRPS